MKNCSKNYSTGLIDILNKMIDKDFSKRIDFDTLS